MKYISKRSRLVQTSSLSYDWSMKKCVVLSLKTNSRNSRIQLSNVQHFTFERELINFVSRRRFLNETETCCVRFPRNQKYSNFTREWYLRDMCLIEQWREKERNQKFRSKTHTRYVLQANLTLVTKRSSLCLHVWLDIERNESS